MPNSGVLVLPRLIVPAASSRSTTSSDTSGTKSAIAAEPNVVRTPAVRLRSLTAVGTPKSGPPSPARASASRAWWWARSPVTVTKAPTSSESRATRSR